MNEPAEQLEDGRASTSEPWRNRWYSAAKRFVIAVAIAFLASMMLNIIEVILGAGFHSESANLVLGLRFKLEPVFRLGPVCAAVWGLCSPREYGRKPSRGRRIGVAVLAVVALLYTIAVYAFLVAFANLVAGGREYSCNEISDESKALCHDLLHLVPDADWRLAGLREDGLACKQVRAKFLTKESDLSRVFDTNAVDLAGVGPGKWAPNVLPLPEKARHAFPAWWTPSPDPVEAGEIGLLDPKEGTNTSYQVSVELLPDGTRALYVCWFRHPPPAPPAFNIHHSSSSIEPEPPPAAP